MIVCNLKGYFPGSQVFMKRIKRIVSFFLCILMLFQLFSFNSFADVRIEYLKGDADLSGLDNGAKLSVDDARQALRFSIELDDYTLAHVMICDMDGDNKISISDARTILRIAIGLDVVPKETVSVGETEFSKWVYESTPHEQTIETYIPSQPSVEKKSGTFIFYTYGYGHTVGFSMYGAVGFDKYAGWDYRRIATHYFNGTELTKWSSIPDTLRYSYYVKNSKGGYDYTTINISPLELLTRITWQEVGGLWNFDNHINKEMVKAQALCIFTLMKRFVDRKEALNYNNVGDMNSYYTYDRIKSVNSDFVAAIKEVFDSSEYMTVSGDNNKEAILSIYAGGVAGKSNDNVNVFGGALSYLTPVSSPYDLMYAPCVDYKVFTKSQVLSMLSGYGLSSISDPSKWIQILEHDASLDSQRGYVIRAKIGNTEISKSKVYSVFGLGSSFNLKSTCFTVEYVP